MNKWFTTPATTPRFKYPEILFVRWVTENYRLAPNYSKIKFLELGSGAGADLKFLEEWKFDAQGVDSNPKAYATFHESIEEFFDKDLIECYDCIYELNVLCSVENPPYREIAAALKPGGKFFAIMPATNTEADFTGLKEQGIAVRTSSGKDMVPILEGLFCDVCIMPYCYPQRRKMHLNWVIEAVK